MNENFEILKVQVTNGALPKRRSNPEYSEKPPDNQPENRYHIIITSESNPHASSNNEDKLIRLVRTYMYKI